MKFSFTTVRYISSRKLEIVYDYVLYCIVLIYISVKRSLLPKQGREYINN